MTTRPGSYPRLRDIPPVPAPFVDEREALTNALRLLLRTGANHLLTTLRGRPAVVTRADLDRVLPSTVGRIARREWPDLTDRVRIGEAVRGPAPVLRAEAAVPDAVAAMRAAGWRPLVVLDGTDLHGVLTPEAILAALVPPGT